VQSAHLHSRVLTCMYSCMCNYVLLYVQSCVRAGADERVGAAPAAAEHKADERGGRHRPGHAPLAPTSAGKLYSIIQIYRKSGGVRCKIKEVVVSIWQLWYIACVCDVEAATGQAGRPSP
jgi:hypothetical protein